MQGEVRQPQHRLLAAGTQQRANEGLVLVYRDIRSPSILVEVLNLVHPFVWGDPPGACKGRDRLTHWCEGDPG